MNIKLFSSTLLIICATVVQAGPLDDLNKAASDAFGKAIAHKASEAAKAKANKAIALKLNKKLLAESRSNQCVFKSNSDELEPGCDNKAKRLAALMIKTKKTLQDSGQSGFKFIVSGHTDTSGDAAKNKDLSKQRAQVMVKQLISHGVDSSDIEAIGMGSDKPLVKPDNTPAKMARNRRYEIQIGF
ncbi:MAG: OmpA family protein [Gallionella sp.]|nr:OmpA family protein [Gallionella sp.]